MAESTNAPTFASDLCTAAAAVWPFESARFVQRFDNVVYRVLLNGSVCYLRFSPESRRTNQQIESELHLLCYLHDESFPANVPVPARDGQLSREIELDGRSFTACVFSECPGVSFEQLPPTDLGGFCRNTGRTLGRLHAVLRAYKRPSEFTRLAWIEERWDQFDRVIPESETAAWALYTELRRSWAALEEPADFGLVHGDFTVRNLHYTNDSVSLFDFDGCCDHWYAYDLACFLHFFSWRPLDQRRIVFGNLLEGYAESCSLSDAMLAQIPVFAKTKLLRGFLVYAIEYGLDNTSSELQRLFESRRRLFPQPPCWPPSQP